MRGTDIRYVALGDSFTEGVGDELPDGSVRGWADLVAAGLAATAGAEVSYANLAVRGRLLEPIVTDQLPAALALSPPPTMITLNGGGNDMLRPGMDAARMVRLVETAVRRCLDAGVRMVLVCGPDPSDRLPFGRTFRARAERLTAQTLALGDRYGVTVVDTFHDLEVRRPGYWSPDRLHLGPAGHRRVAALVLRGLGHDVPLPEPGALPAVPGGLLAEVRYYSEYVRPWLHRRLRGRSSGDGLTAKSSVWATVAPPSSAPPLPDRRPRLGER